MAKVSVVIPVYGVEKYIERCARSLFEQTLNDVEFIFVNDCTPDKSIEILEGVIEEYPQRKAQIRMEKMPHNSGLPAVRKYGISLAQGEYIIGCDSDDYIDKDMYQTMYEFAVKNNCDLVQCDIAVVDDIHNINVFSSKKNELTSDELKSLILDGDISNSLCNKLIKRTVFTDNPLSYPTVGMDEDNALAVQLAYYSKELGYIKKPFYKAYVNSASMSRVEGRDKVLKKLDESLANSKLIISFLKSKGFDDASKSIIRAKLRPKLMLCENIKSIKDVNLWKSVYPEINYKFLFDTRFRWTTRVRCLLVMMYLYPLYKKFH